MAASFGEPLPGIRGTWKWGAFGEGKSSGFQVDNMKDKRRSALARWLWRSGGPVRTTTAERTRESDFRGLEPLEPRLLLSGSTSLEAAYAYDLALSEASATAAPAPAQAVPSSFSDFDGDGRVATSDLDRWSSSYGQTSGATRAQGDADGDGDVDVFDLGLWQDQIGLTVSITTDDGQETLLGDVDGDKDVDAFDLALWQTGFGTDSGAVLLNGDIDGDGDVDAFDLAIWQVGFAEHGDGGSDGEPLSSGNISTSGWTVFEPSADTRIIYVDAQGDDSNDGLTPQTAVRTAARAEGLVRDGHPDWILFEAGDTFDSVFGGWGLSGRSEGERLLVSTYGDGPRPVFETNGQTFVNVGKGGVNHVAFVGLHVYDNFRDPAHPHFDPEAEPTTGFRMIGVNSDLVFEDLHVEFFKDNIVLQGPNGDEPQSRDVRIRRNIIRNSHSNQSHSQGIYIAQWEGVLIEQNLFDHNGWNDAVPGAEKTIFNHNVYVQTNARNITVRDNIFARASSHGIQVRPGGIVENNLFVENALAFFVTRADSVVRRNVVLNGTDISESLPRGFGISTFNLDTVLIEDNIVSQRVGNGGKPGIEAGGNAITLRDNIVWDWFNRDGQGIAINGTAVENTGNRATADFDYLDPNRDLAGYMATLDRPASLDAFLDAAAARGRQQWDPLFTPDAVYDYIRAGFEPASPA